MSEMPLELSDREMAALDELSDMQEMSKEAVMRQSLRVYQRIVWQRRVDALWGKRYDDLMEIYPRGGVEEPEL